MEPVKYLSPAEASAFLKNLGLDVEPATLSKYRSVGGGAEFHFFGRFPKYTEAALCRWVSERISPPFRSTSELGRVARGKRGRPPKGVLTTA